MKALTDKQKRIVLIALCAVGIPLLLSLSLVFGGFEHTAAARIRLSEVMTHNRSVYADAEGAYHDWLELHNTADHAISLDGFSLTDDPEQPEKYVFPDLTLSADGYTVIFLSGDSKETRAGYAPFGLSDNGDTVYLCYRKNVVDELGITASPENVSFGRKADTDYLQWFAKPTPAAANSGIAANSVEALREACYTGVMFSEVAAVSAADETDWIELHNTTDKPLNLTGYRLTDAPENAGLTLEETVLEAGAYLTVFCDRLSPEGISPCAPFSLGRFGDTVYLYTPDGILCDYLETGKQRDGITAGRDGDDRSKLVYFDEATPGEANGKAYLGYAPTPTFNRVGGYVQDDTAVTLTVPPDCTVYYTTAGAEPSEKNHRYTAGDPITIHKNTVLRAVALRDGYLPSDIATQTFLTADRHDIPTISVSGSPAALFGGNGAFTQFNNENLSAVVHAEYFDKNGNKVLAFDSSLRIAGGLSRYDPQKSFTLKLSQRTGPSTVTYPFFADTTVTTFSDLLLRPSGADWSKAKMRDEFVATALKGQTDLLTMSAQPVALYINGSYHGLYYLREKRNESYVSAYTGIPEEHVQLVKQPALYEWGVPLDPAMKELIDYAKKHDLREEEHYQYVLSQINADSLMRYFIVETYFGNGDMINNVACYRDARGGKWNWLLFDLDWACTAYYADNQFLLQLKNGGVNTFQNYYYPLLTALLKNEAFEQQFLKTYADMMNTTFDPERLLPIVDTMADAIRSEIPRQQNRYGSPSPARFESEVKYIRKFLENRQDTMTRQIKNVFDLTDEEWDALQ